MKTLMMEHKKVLGLHPHMDWLSIMEKEIKSAYPSFLFYKATNYEDGLQLMLSLTFDLVVSDLRMERGKELVRLATGREFPLLIISDNGVSSNLLERLEGLKGHMPLSVANLEEIVPGVARALNGGYRQTGRGVTQKITAFFSALVSGLSPKEIDRQKYTGISNFIYY